jgi:hypothetical protein
VENVRCMVGSGAGEHVYLSTYVCQAAGSRSKKRREIERKRERERERNVDYCCMIAVKKGDVNGKK